MKETELTFYAPIGDYDGFEHAVSTEIQTQYAFPVNDGKERVRSSVKNGEVSYELTIKRKDPESVTLTEATVPVTEAFYNEWLKLHRVKGVNKIRYTFLSQEVELRVNADIIHLPELKYEVDVFLDSNGKRSKWCKIDIELDSLKSVIEERGLKFEDIGFTVGLSNLPIKLDIDKAFSGDKATAEQQEAINSFWEKFSYLPSGVEEFKPEVKETQTEAPQEEASTEVPEETPAENTDSAPETDEGTEETQSSEDASDL